MENFMSEDELALMRELYQIPLWKPGSSFISYISPPEAVHAHGCPATSMAQAKKPWECTCGAQELEDKFKPLWDKLMEIDK